MIPINPTVKFWILVVLTGASGALAAIFKLQPTWAWIAAVLPVLAVVESYFTVPASKDGPKSAVGKLPPLYVLFFVCALGLACAGCPQADATIPADVVLIECVADDAVAQKPIAQIVTDCGTDLDTVVAILLASKKPTVAQSPAALEAKAAHGAR
jgi:hypothetical protein